MDERLSISRIPCHTEHITPFRIPIRVLWNRKVWWAFNPLIIGNLHDPPLQIINLESFRKN